MIEYLNQKQAEALGVFEAVSQSWSAETSNNGTGSRQVPSRGQCAVTALVIQDLLDGDILRTEVDGISHYWNRLPDGHELDLTRDQFPRFAAGEVERRSRAHLISDEDTRRRYDILRMRVNWAMPGRGRRAGAPLLIINRAAIDP